MLVAGASTRVGLVLISHSAHTKPGVRLTQRICWDGSVHLGMEELGEGGGGGGEQHPCDVGPSFGSGFLSKGLPLM